MARVGYRDFSFRRRSRWRRPSRRAVKDGGLHAEEDGGDERGSQNGHAGGGENLLGEAPRPIVKQATTITKKTRRGWW